MAAMELGESSADERLAIGVMMNRPTAIEAPPRIRPKTEARETRGGHPALRVALMFSR